MGKRKLRREKKKDSIKAKIRIAILGILFCIAFYVGIGIYKENKVELVEENNIIVEAWAPLGKGSMLQNEDLIRIAKKYNKSVAQLCIRWCLQNDIIPLPKTTNLTRMAENRDVFDFTIDKDDMSFINNMELFASSTMKPDEFGDKK